jgi:chaperonin cofactor prefoldin
MKFQEKIQQINQLNERLELLNKRLKYSEEQLKLIDDPNLIHNDYSAYYAEGGELKLWAKPKNIRRALVDAIDDLKTDIKNIERQLSELIK